MTSSYLERVFDKRFDPNQPRDEEGRWTDSPGTGGGSLQEVADSVATAAIAWGRLKGDDPPPHDEVAKRWKKNLRGRLSEDEEMKAEIREAEAENARNPLFQRIMERFVADNVVVVKAPEEGHARVLVDVHGSAQRIGGTTQARDDAMREIRDDLAAGNGKDIRDADAAASSAYGIAAVLRHEYGHSIDDLLDAGAKQRIREALPNPGDDLTYYAGRASQEVVPELLAIITHPDYRESDWPESVQRAARILMEEMGVEFDPTKALSPPSSYLERLFKKEVDRDRSSSYLERVFDKRFDPDQPRDERGRWSETPGGEISADMISADETVELTEGVVKREAVYGANNATKVIDSVHSIPADLGQARVGGEVMRDTSLGEFNSQTQAIALNGSQLASSQQAAETFAHEFGHWLDFRLGETRIGSGAHFLSDDAFYTAEARDAGRSIMAGDEGDTFVPIAQAIYRSEAWQQIAEKDADGNWHARSNPDIGPDAYVGYLAKPREAFARAYAQWIASHRPRVFEGHYRVGSEIWTDEDFAPIASAFDEAFGSMGLLKEQDGQ